MPTDAVLDLVHQLMSSPWIYLAILGLSLVDAFLPALPSEGVVITVGVFAAATGTPDLAPAILAAAAGAFVGDHVSYWLGRTGGGRLARRARPGGRREAVLRRFAAALERRGGLMIVVARYVPGGRTAVTLAAGTVGYSRRRFTAWAALAALSWATYSALVGYVGGAAFEENPLLGVAAGIGFALATALTIETALRFSAGRTRRRAELSRGG